MLLPDAKALEKIAKLCRKLGVKQLKTSELEIILTDDSPAKPRRRVAGKSTRSEGTSQLTADVVESEQLTEDQLLFWSSSNTEEQSQ